MNFETSFTIQGLMSLYVRRLMFGDVQRRCLLDLPKQRLGLKFPTNKTVN